MLPSAHIAPFLAWLHRFAPLVGKVNVPSVEKLRPDALTRCGFARDLDSLLLGIAAILTVFDLLCRLTGLPLSATAASIVYLLPHMLLHRSPVANREW